MYFNVVQDAWIPVKERGGPIRLMGIRRVLEEAAALTEISDPSPLSEYAVYRFLCVFLMDALRPESREDLEDLLETGRFDMDKIDDYLKQCEREGVSFDLFDEKRPFMQTPYDARWDKESKPAATLEPTIPSGNNHPHFDHRRCKDMLLSPDEAFRMLLVKEMFCTAEAQGYPSGVNGAPPYFTIVRGDTLFQTLIYGLKPIDEIAIFLDDPPVFWRNPLPVEGKKEIGGTSWLYGMFFPARRICLLDSGEEGISRIQLSQGLNYVNKDAWRDPFVTYVFNDKGRHSLKPNRDKPIWRNLNVLLNSPGKCAPEVLTQYTAITEEPFARLTVYGVETSNASYVDLFRKDLMVSTEITKDPQRIDFLTDAIEAAEKVGQVLRKALKKAEVLSESGIPQAVREYFDQCEADFWELCSVHLMDSSLSAQDLIGIYQQWCDILIGYARAGLDTAITRVRLRGKTLETAAASQIFLLKELGKIKKEASKL